MISDIQKAVESGTITTAAGSVLEKLGPGAFVMHKSWGFGQIDSFDFLVNQVTINFKGKKGHTMQLSYAAESLTAHGLARGSWLAFCRVIRCHPWHEGGFDPVLADDFAVKTRAAALVAEESLRCYDQVNDRMYGEILEIRKLDLCQSSYSQWVICIFGYSTSPRRSRSAFVCATRTNSSRI